MTIDKAIPQPIFIIGSYRSGTSVLTWCLGQHSNIWLLPETNWIADYALSVQRWFEKGGTRPRSHFVMSKMSEEQAYASFAQSADDLIKRSCEWRVKDTQFQKGEFEYAKVKLRPDDPKERWVDGTPEYSHYVSALLRLFPRAKFIHMLRNPHDVVRSLMHFDRVGDWKTDAPDGYKTWQRLTKSAYAAEQAFGSDKVRRFLHQDLVNQPEQLLKDMFAFIGEPYEAESMLAVQNKMNSSQVDDVEMSDDFRNSALGKKAQKLFDELESGKDTPLSPDADVAKKLRKEEDRLRKKL